VKQRINQSIPVDIIDRTLLLMEESVRRTALYVNHKYYTPKQAVEYNIHAYAG
jgi:hypothetical protein